MTDHRAEALTHVQMAARAIETARRLLDDAATAASLAGEHRAAVTFLDCQRDLSRLKVPIGRALAGPVVAVWPDAELTVPTDWGDEL